MADTPVTNPPAEQVDAASDLLPPVNHLQLAQAKASEVVGHIADHLAGTDQAPDSAEEADQNAPIEIGDAEVTPVTATEYLTGQLSPLLGGVATAKPANRAFPESAQQRQGFAPGSVNAATAASMRGRSS